MSVSGENDYYYADVPIDHIIRHPQIKDRNVEDITVLSRSIEEVGTLHDPILEEVPETTIGYYYMLAGKRRVEAIRQAGGSIVHAKIYRRGRLSERKRLLINFAENLGILRRRAVYRANVYRRLVEAGVTQREIARLEGNMTEQEISHYMHIHDLPDNIKNLPKFEFFELSKCLILLRARNDIRFRLAQELNNLIDEEGKCRITDKKLKQLKDELETQASVSEFLQEVEPGEDRELVLEGEERPEPQPVEMPEMPQTIPEPSTLEDFPRACPIKDIITVWISQSRDWKIDPSECERCRRHMKEMCERIKRLELDDLLGEGENQA